MSENQVQNLEIYIKGLSDSKISEVQDLENKPKSTETEKLNQIQNKENQFKQIIESKEKELQELRGKAEIETKEKLNVITERDNIKKDLTSLKLEVENFKKQQIEKSVEKQRLVENKMKEVGESKDLEIRKLREAKESEIKEIQGTKDSEILNFKQKLQLVENSKEKKSMN